MTTKHNPIILALDYSSYEDALAMAQNIKPYVGMLKVGLELYTAVGPKAFDIGSITDLPLFLDLKLCDIPTTVAKTVKTLCNELSKVKGNHFLSVHTFGGEEMINAAIDAAKGSNVEIVGITALTSFTDYHMHKIGLVDTVENFALNLAGVSKSLGAFVCPPEQLKSMRWKCGKDAKLISPGIRFEAGSKDDHTAANTPKFALSNGANYLVIGRPITQATDPIETAKMLCEIVGS